MGSVEGKDSHRFTKAIDMTVPWDSPNGKQMPVARGCKTV